MFNVKLKLCTLINVSITYGLRTRIQEGNFSMHEIAAYTTCTYTYFYVHEKKRARKFLIFQALLCGVNSNLKKGKKLSPKWE